MKKVIVISTSLHKGSNSDMLADKFIEGATAAGHGVEKIFLIGKEIKFCIGYIQSQHCVDMTSPCTITLWQMQRHVPE